MARRGKNHTHQTELNVRQGNMSGKTNIHVHSMYIYVCIPVCLVGKENKKRKKRKINIENSLAAASALHVCKNQETKQFTKN